MVTKSRRLLKNALKGVGHLKPHTRPDLSTDRLYQSNVLHKDREQLGMACCGTDLTVSVPRDERPEHNDCPAIYYGLTASANQIMKDVAIRDTLAAENNDLCFETEAAGLTSRFPPHVWSYGEYATIMTMAAYTEDFLLPIPLYNIEHCYWGYILHPTAGDPLMLKKGTKDIP